MPGIPHDPGADSQTRFVAVRAPTLHRTIGSWPGDYSVGKNRLHSSPGTFNFLVGANDDQWVQFYRADNRCSHAAGANYAGPGIEISGQNGAPLTPWQVARVGDICRWLSGAYGVPDAFRDGDPRFWVDQSGHRGYVTHRAVDYPPNISYRHYDYITYDEYLRGRGAAGPTPPPAPLLEELDMGAVIQNQGATIAFEVVRDGPDKGALRHTWLAGGAAGAANIWPAGYCALDAEPRLVRTGPESYAVAVQSADHIRELIAIYNGKSWQKAQPIPADAAAAVPTV